jgi:hypothetical protein
MIEMDVLTDYLVWSDPRLISLLEGLTEEELGREFNDLSGNVQAKTAHIVSIHDFFISRLDEEPYGRFQSEPGSVRSGSCPVQSDVTPAEGYALCVTEGAHARQGRGNQKRGRNDDRHDS